MPIEELEELEELRRLRDEADVAEARRREADRSATPVGRDAFMARLEDEDRQAAQ
ncbi:hypothetical protein ACTVZO_19030 [Streptomyces sp. IBSNAI002]|uniref:hypothetical protein n=1 Tax=Streptomyces sp. IBSNAI002 TaxID=3457500 RepID=UPI003FD52746